MENKTWLCVKNLFYLDRIPLYKSENQLKKGVISILHTLLTKCTELNDTYVSFALPIYQVL